MKKGLGVGQVFVFMIAAITFSLIMIFGYQYVTEFIERGEQVEFIKFKNTLESSVRRIYTEYGAVRVTEFNMPSRYNQICFVDLDYPQELKNNELDQLKEKDFLAANLWKDAKDYSSADQNVFIQPVSEVRIKVYNIKLLEGEKEVGFLCFDVIGGRFSMILEGRGSHTLLSPVPKNE